MIASRAKKIRDHLLQKHETSPFLTVAEVKGMEKCNFSEVWARKFAAQNGWKSKALHGERESVDIEKATPHIDTICTLIKEYELDCVYNMDETALFYKCLPNRSYLNTNNDYKNARGTKLMKAKDRTTVFVCTNATGTDKVPLSLIGKAKSPRCFENRNMKSKYYSQKRAWSDTTTFMKWWRDFQVHVRRRTTKNILLILDNCGPHGTKELVDENEQIRVVFLPPNCTSVFQPMDSGVIAMLKKNYRTRLLRKMLETYDDRENLHRSAARMRNGTRGLSEGYPPHLRDVMDILFEVWEEVKLSSVHNCWVKSQLIFSEQDPTTTSTFIVDEDTHTSEALVEANAEDNDDVDVQELYRLASDFAKNVCLSAYNTISDKTDYDDMIEEMVVTVNTTKPEDARQMIDGWMEMEDNDYCTQATINEVEEVLEDVGGLINLKEKENADSDEDMMDVDDSDECCSETTQPKKITPSKDRIFEIAWLLKDLSIELDTFEGDFKDLSCTLDDASNSLQIRRRQLESRRVKEKMKNNKFRQSNFQQFLKR